MFFGQSIVGTAVCLIIVFVVVRSLLSSSGKVPRSGQDITSVLVRQIARWSIAAKQDINPFIATLHANYAAGYLWALKDLVSEGEIDKITNYRALEKRVTQIQTDTTTKLTRACPMLIQNGDLFRLAGDA